MTESGDTGDAEARQSFEAWFERFDPSPAHIARLINLNDGVFAFALTLLAIEVRPPEHWDGTLGGLGADFRTGLAAFLLGFAVLGALWARQRRVLALLTRIDAVTTALALVCLAMVSLLPAAVGMQIRHGDKPLSIIIYVGVFLALIVASSALWAYVALVRRFVHPELPARFRYGEFGAQAFMALSMVSLLAGFWSNRAQSVITGSSTWMLPAAFCMVVSMVVRRWSRTAPKGGR